MHSWLDFRWGKDLNQQPHQNVSITGTVQAIYGPSTWPSATQPAHDRQHHRNRSNPRQLSGKTHRFNELSHKTCHNRCNYYGLDANKTGNTAGRGKTSPTCRHWRGKVSDGARSDRGKLTSPPKDCSKVVLLALTYRCLDVPHRSVRYTHTTCGYTSTIITLHVYTCICWMFPYLVHASSESFY